MNNNNSNMNNNVVYQMPLRPEINPNPNETKENRDKRFAESLRGYVDEEKKRLNNIKRQADLNKAKKNRPENRSDNRPQNAPPIETMKRRRTNSNIGNSSRRTRRSNSRNSGNSGNSGNSSNSGNSNSNNNDFSPQRNASNDLLNLREICENSIKEKKIKNIKYKEIRTQNKDIKLNKMKEKFEEIKKKYEDSIQIVNTEYENDLQSRENTLQLFIDKCNKLEEDIQKKERNERRMR